MILSKPAVVSPFSFLLVLIVLVSSPSASQELAEMEYEELSAQMIVADPETSVLRVESTIPGLQFNSRGGIKRVREPEEGVWEVLLHPGVHYMEIRASGYLLLKLDRMNFEPKGGRKIRVRAKAQVAATTDRNPELRLTWSDLPAGDVYVQIDRDPVQKIASARGGVTLRPPAGQRTVRVVAGGRQWQRTIGFEEGQQYSERVVLESAAEEAISVANPGEIYVESDPVGARVYLNGVEQEGSTPINLTDLSPGSYTLELRLPQYEVATVRAEVRSLDILKINETLVPTFATVSIASDPSGALLYIDGEQVGSTPFRGRVERGQRQLRLELPQYGSLAEAIEIEAGVEFSKSYTLDPLFSEAEITSVPTGADLYVDDEYKGATPFRGRIGKGSHHFRLVAPLYWDLLDTLEVKVGGTLNEQFVLKPRFGTVVVESTPTGAAVSVDGQSWGQTPVRREQVRSGSYSIQISKAPYGVEVRSVAVEDGGVARLDIDLTGKVGTMNLVSEPSGATVTLVESGERLGVTPIRDRPMAPGLYTVRLEMSGYDAAEEIIPIERGVASDTKVSLVQQVGHIRIESEPPGASVYVDGKQIEGTTPLIARDISVGSRQVMLKLSDYLERSERVSIARDELASLSLSLDKKPQFMGGKVKLSGGASMEFVWIKPGNFLMGSPANESGRGYDEAQHRVTISKGFNLGKYEVTQEQWKAVMGTTPWRGQSNVKSDKNRPAVYVSWADAQKFIDRLNQSAGDIIYRLPTEAEWEYAARAGTKTRWSHGNDERQLGKYAWYGSKKKESQRVGKKKPNPWGLYDMHGNVYEWCQGWYGAYATSAQVDPQGPSAGSYRVVRGGDFYSRAQGVRSANRSSLGDPGSRDYRLGFRLLRTE